MTSSAIQKLLELYVKKIKAGTMTLDDVPFKWRDEVRRMLEEDL